MLYLLGANGTGKSALISKVFSAHSAKAKRVSAHRQTWFHSNTLDMTPHGRENLERNVRTHDGREDARYIEGYTTDRASMAIYDLIDLRKHAQPHDRRLRQS